MRYLNSRVVFALSLAALLTGCEFHVGDGGWSERYQTDFHYSCDLNADGRVNVESLNGSVEITGWDENKVDISGTKYGSTEALRDEVKIDIRNSASSVDIRTVRPSVNMGSVGARYVIRVPRKAHLERITTSNAAIHVRDVASATHLKSSNGSVKVENVEGDVEARTSNSSIDMNAVRGNASMKTSNGRISAEDLGGTVEAETSNSSIRLHLASAPPAPIRLNSSNGSIELTMEKAPMQDIRAQTRNGGITLRIPANSSAGIVAETSNSAISSDFDLRSGNDDRRKNHLEGTLGTGGPRIDLSSSNGHIRILKGSGE